MPSLLPAGTGPSSILIVDDMLTNVLLLEALVKTISDTAPVCFTEPEAALAWCRKNEPDLVLLDYMMPGLDGIALLKAIRGLPHMSTVPVVLVTGQEDTAARYRAFEAGAADFITKPIDELELRVRTRNMLKLRANARDLYRLATTDELTGLANRRSFLAGLEDEATRALRYPGQRVSLAILDVDHFKRVNDTYGHPIGDATLREVSAVCKGLFRKVDLVGRIGGEEFATLLPATVLDDAALVCDRLRQQVAETEIRAGETPFRVTISVGIAEFTPGETTAQLLARADHALYAAKTGGRNRIALAASETGSLTLGS
jgi:two-component system cell cycle response regulator